MLTSSTPKAPIPLENNDIEGELVGDVGEPQNNEAEYYNMNLTELKVVAKEKGIEGYSKFNKAELIEVILATIS